MILHVLRSFYALGLVPAVPLFILMANHASKDMEVSVPVLIGCLVYFVLGYMLFKVIPDWLRRRVMARVERHKTKGFVPQWEVGFDPMARKALYVDVNDGTEAMIDFDNVNAWELDVDKNKPALLKLLTRIPTLPVLGLRIDRREADRWKANLNTIFG